MVNADLIAVVQRNEDRLAARSGYDALRPGCPSGRLLRPSSRDR